MIKIVNRQEALLLKNLPQEVVEKVVEITSILDENYGAARNGDIDLGGYVLIVEKGKNIEHLKELIDLENTLPEYVDLITCQEGGCYTNSLMQLSSD